MTATDELRRLLDDRGVKWDELVGHSVVVGTAWHDRDGCPCTALEHADDVPDGILSVQANLTPEQAIAATLGSELPYDELLRCLENDWHISASWDGLRKFWCIELTEEGVKLRNSAHVTLTAEQVMGIAGKHQPDYCSDTHVCFDWQAIADELNATLGSGTCKVESMHGYTDAHMHTSWFVELSCHTLDAWEDSIPPSYCPICGARVVE